MESLNSQNSELHNFIEFLYGDLNGLAYIATKNPDNPLEWNTHFFQYPAESHRMETVILQNSDTSEVYISPALYKEPRPIRENVKCSNVVWTEFDGDAPSLEDYANPPSLIVRSSSERNQHVYWRLSEPIYDVDTLEQVNRNITYAMGADSSAWDATQVLRPPSTKNHKRGTDVTLVVDSATSYDVAVFDTLPTAPEQIDTSNWQLGVLPDINDVILKYPFSPDLILLLKKEKDEVKDRSASLMNLAYGCAEMGLSDAEIFVMLKLADDRWGKFKDRRDRNKRLAHIITVARHKHPAEESGEQFTFALDFLSFLNTDIEIDWVIEGMLMEQGSMLFVGPSGIGKTQLSLQFMIHLALGKDFLHYKIARPFKILFLSLEMGFGELKVFVEDMAKELTNDELLLLQENLILVPHGEKWALNTPVGQHELIKLMEDIQPDGLFTDSVGSAIQGNISDDETIMGLVDFNDRLRKKYGCFVWYIHHLRKKTNGGHAPSDQDDVYGNQYLVNRATSSYALLFAKNGKIKVRNFKNRLAKKEEDYIVERRENYQFHKLNEDIDDAIMHLEYKKPEDEKGPADPKAGNFDL